MKSALTWAAAISFTFAATATTLAQNDPRVAREGDGARRTALNERELNPFPMDAFSKLASWSGTPVDAKSIEGKPVLIITWSHWYRPTWDALRVAQRMHEQHGGDGLIVVGIHSQREFDGAAKFFADRGYTFPFAHDVDGGFRKALDVDQDPDFYVIDRAGQLRFADILTSAVEQAASIVVAETASDAAAIPGRLAAKAAAADEAARRTRQVSDSERPGTELNVPFTMPDASAYAAVKWPERNANLHAGDFQGQALPTSHYAETWITPRPNTEGKIVVFDFWATWCGPCVAAMPGLDALQKQHRRDLVIIGMSGQGSGETVGKIRGFLRTHKSAYTHAHDSKQTLYNAMNISGIPHMVVVSTDGVIRWQGMPSEKGFKTAVEHLIRVDPGVQARRAAEEAFLQTQRAGKD